MSGYLDRNPFIFILIIILMICSLIMVIFGDPITRVMGAACAWATGIATKSIKGN